ncbi:Bifunctional purine biosynthesis protein PurH [Candidatus Izimaplasma bacterium HR1]|jgi:phosphoribosylaminoimidazolecarboxamide formyltransferase/IMP cyclohydrolase|uniref:bifunctional phosphoribosylaminoimidazolecarboxamide formyltransferase/IMP cyclohydrolase n=1 Tax=Candidatus Izimoplasma sp. HR1 TaxID=1541959 RepID=UPI0004F6F6E7|nr:Bifunctional purine biosynthesis protein PurH [Candidatus Izimaplasma bacterium HR1]
MKRALISVSDKTNIVEFAKELQSLDFEIISTGGTRRVLEENGVKTISIDEITGFPEILNGRVKTLHPKVHGGLLSLRNDELHIKEVKENNIEYIDLVCVNLYPFKQTIAKEGTTFDEAIEQIDIGGPSMLRSAAKNYQFVTVVTDINDYDKIIEEMKDLGDTSLETKKHLSAKVFRKTAQYDSYIANYLTKELDIENPESVTLTYDFHQSLRYGENPHQKASLYRSSENPYSLLNCETLNGKPLSYNNIQDANSAINILKEFTKPTVVALKHMNPCGVGTASNIIEAFQKAYLSDPVSIFGGIIALNKEVTLEVAKEMNKIFLEIIIAPSYELDALLELKKKKNLRVLVLDTSSANTDVNQTVTVNGGVLFQNLDNYIVDKNELKNVTNQEVTEQEINELHFAWKVAKHVKSNAIVVTKGTQTVGIGAGQMNRVGAAEIALEWAKKYGHKEDLSLASDAFFPFDDVVRLAHEYGVTKIIQPGGSIRDKDSIKACNELGIKMVFTSNRHFKH